MDPHTKSELAVPIICDHITIGVINAESPLKNAFSTTDARLIEILADVVNWVLKFSSELFSLKKHIGKINFFR